MEYNLRASHADKFNSPTCVFGSSGSAARFFDFLANSLSRTYSPLKN